MTSYRASEIESPSTRAAWFLLCRWGKVPIRCPRRWGYMSAGKGDAARSPHGKGGGWPGGFCC